MASFEIKQLAHDLYLMRDTPKAMCEKYWALPTDVKKQVQEYVLASVDGNETPWKTAPTKDE